MFRRLTEWYLDRLIAEEKASLPNVDARDLLDRITFATHAEDLFYVETRDERVLPLNPDQPNSEGLDVVSLIVTRSRDGILPWDTEEPAETLADRLSDRDDISAIVQLSRRLDSFVGYYVRIRPKTPRR